MKKQVSLYKVENNVIHGVGSHWFAEVNKTSVKHVNTDSDVTDYTMKAIEEETKKEFTR